jgi:hypothetical protein
VRWPCSYELQDAEQIAVCAAGYTAEEVFQCPAHERTADDDNGKIYLLLKAAGFSEEDHPARIAEGNSVARARSTIDGPHQRSVYRPSIPSRHHKKPG